jgi:hypothetical protein
VAFSRAKRKLIVVGSRSTLRASHLLGSFISLVEERGWCLELPPTAHVLYDVPSPRRRQQAAPQLVSDALGWRPTGLSRPISCSTPAGCRCRYALARPQGVVVDSSGEAWRLDLGSRTCCWQRNAQASIL